MHDHFPNTTEHNISTMEPGCHFATAVHHCAAHQSHSVVDQVSQCCSSCWHPPAATINTNQTNRPRDEFEATEERHPASKLQFLYHECICAHSQPSIQKNNMRPGQKPCCSVHIHASWFALFLAILHIKACHIEATHLPNKKSTGV